MQRMLLLFMIYYLLFTGCSAPAQQFYPIRTKAVVGSSNAPDSTLTVYGGGNFINGGINTTYGAAFGQNVNVLSGGITVEGNSSFDDNVTFDGASTNIIFNNGLRIGNGGRIEFTPSGGDGWLVSAALTTLRQWTLPNQTGTVALANGTAQTNLNADLLDGSHASAFAAASHSHSAGDLPVAGSGAAGIVSTSSQSFSGTKTFLAGLNISSGQKITLVAAGGDGWIQPGSLTTLRSWTFPDATGTVALGSSSYVFGAVNSVSPTSPNRTITVTIGGTTYYIHAKTTND